MNLIVAMLVLTLILVVYFYLKRETLTSIDFIVALLIRFLINLIQKIKVVYRKFAFVRFDAFSSLSLSLFLEVVQATEIAREKSIGGDTWMPSERATERN